LDEKDEKSALIELRKLACLIPSGKAVSDSYVLVHDQIKRLEQNLKEDLGTLTSAEEGKETQISVKKDEKKVERKKKNVYKIIKPQLKKQSEEKDDSLKGSDIIVCSLENWLKNINRIYEKT
jgi:uncharacterized membrane protein YcgQ (UPF0703/DUF1980 family)